MLNTIITPIIVGVGVGAAHYLHSYIYEKNNTSPTMKKYLTHYGRKKSWIVGLIAFIAYLLITN
ncbi:MAG: hypothetical protein ABIH92_00950 [Nanoarchaeota archaeon]